jgi:integrase
MSDRVPSYRRHKQSGQAIVTLTDGLGHRKDVLLGKWQTQESRKEYARVLAEWEAAGRNLSAEGTGSDITLNELMLRFWPWAEMHYRLADGSPSREIESWKLSLRPLREWYGTKLVRDIGPLALKALRDKMIAQPVTRRVKVAGKPQEKVIRQGLARGVINQRIARIRRMFKWGVENELVPVTVYQALKAVSGLERGRSAARETKPVEPIALAWVEATLPYLMPTTADMVQLQLLTGARSGEICDMRAVDIDRAGAIWLYSPARHKMAHRGKKRVIAIGPRGQEIVKRRLKANVGAYLFSPADAVAEKRERARASRKTKIFPCEIRRVQKNKRRKPKIAAGDRYAPTAFAIAIRRAIIKANKDREAQGLPPIPRWHPHRLRHTRATEIRRIAGLDAARAALGHSSPQVTELYAELDLGKAIEVASMMG